MKRYFLFLTIGLLSLAQAGLSRGPVIGKLEPAAVEVAILTDGNAPRASDPLKIYGKNFRRGCVAELGGRKMATTFVSEAELRATIDWGHLNKLKWASQKPAPSEPQRSSIRVYRLRILCPGQAASKSADFAVTVSTMGG